MTERILVTGADGFVGRQLSPQLVAAGHEVLPVDLAQGGDVTRAETFARYANCGVTAVVHLAGRVYVPASRVENEDFQRVNVEGTRQAASFAARAGARLLLVSAYVYGVPDYLPVDERHPVRPNNPYAQSKYAAETAARASGAPLLILRPFNLYGAGQDARFLVPTLLRQARAGNDLVVRDLSTRRDFLHSDDFCAAVLAVLGLPDWHEPRVFNVGYGCSWSVADMVALMGEILGRSLRVREEGARRAQEIKDTVADCRVLQAATGWRPQVSLRAGLARLLLPKG